MGKFLQGSSMPGQGHGTATRQSNSSATTMHTHMRCPFGPPLSGFAPPACPVVYIFLTVYVLKVFCGLS